MAGDPYATTLYANGADVYSLGTYQTSSPSIATAPNYGFPYSGSNLPDPTLFTYSGITYSFVREGYEFVEWNTAADGTGTSHNIGDNILGTFYAIWQPLATGSGGGSLTVSYDGNQIWQGTSGNLTLPTDGKIMDGDITLALTGGGGGGGNPEAEPNDVEFIDYDGTIRYSYTAAEFANLTALPPNPTHDGLTAQGWNWTLADAKAYVASYGGLVIGQMYITDDGKTRIYIELTENALSPYLGIGVNGTAIVEWGDGATTNVTGSSLNVTKYSQHIYSSAGNYIIKITAPSGSGTKLMLRGMNASYISGSLLLRKNAAEASTGTTISNEDKFTYLNRITKIEIGERTEIGTYGLSWCYGLRSITIPLNTPIAENAFTNSSALYCVVFPATSATLNIGGGSMYACRSFSIPKATNISFSTGFSSTYSVRKITIPTGITTFPQSAFAYIRKINNFFVPEGVTTFSGYAFQGSGLSEITLPSSMTSLGGAAFNNCYGLNYIKFKSSTPPTATGSNTFGNLPTTCKIYVPSASLNTYKSATNYPSSSTYTYVGY